MKTRRGTESSVDQRLAASAAQTYRIHMRDCRNALSKLDSLLKRHETEFNKKPNDWGYAGDLGKIHGDLMEMIRFLG